MSTSPDRADVNLDTLAEALVAIGTKTPRHVPVLELVPPTPAVVADRVHTVAATVAEIAGVHLDGEQVRSPTRLVLKGSDNARVVGFLASGAVSVRTGVNPFDLLFDTDPGDDEIARLSHQSLDRLGWLELVPDEHVLTFERAWRIKAAGGDADGILTSPVLCRVVGAFRDHVNDLPVLGRASMTLELTGKETLASATLSMRHLRGDGGGKRISEVEVARPSDAAASVVATLTRAFGEGTSKDVRIAAEAFEFGYLSVGRRRRQSALAPFYVATVALDHGQDQEATAHVVAVPASKELFVRLPVSRRTSASQRAA